MRLPSLVWPLLLAPMLGCPADPDPADTEGATSGPTSGPTSSPTTDDSATSNSSISTTFGDPCGTAGCEVGDGTTLDCGTGDCCDVNPNFCPPTGTETDFVTGTDTVATDGMTGSTSDTGGSSGSTG